MKLLPSLFSISTLVMSQFVTVMPAKADIIQSLNGIQNKIIEIGTIQQQTEAIYRGTKENNATSSEASSRMNNSSEKSRADYRSSIQKPVLERLESMKNPNYNDQKEVVANLLYMKVLGSCLEGAITKPNNYNSQDVDTCEQITGVLASYDISKNSCFAILAEPKGFYPGVMYYCEKKTGHTTESVNAAVNKAMREAR